MNKPEAASVLNLDAFLYSYLTTAHLRHQMRCIAVRAFVSKRIFPAGWPSRVHRASSNSSRDARIGTDSSTGRLAGPEHSQAVDGALRELNVVRRCSLFLVVTVVNERLGRAVKPRFKTVALGDETLPLGGNDWPGIFDLLVFKRAIGREGLRGENADRRARSPAPLRRCEHLRRMN
jgi:hypothetical protein